MIDGGVTGLYYWYQDAMLFAKQQEMAAEGKKFEGKIKKVKPFIRG